jgi:hypothetical protein
MTRQADKSPATTQKTKGRLEMTYTQVTRNSIEMLTTANNTQGDILIKLMLESFTHFETILSKQAEQMTTFMTLLTMVLSEMVK